MIVPLVMLVFISGCVTQPQESPNSMQNQSLNDNKSILSDSFTISLREDDSSSGGSRYTNIQLIFQDRKLTSGWQKYESWPGSGAYYHIVCEWEVNTSSLSWIDKNRSEGCVYSPKNVPLTMEGLGEAISAHRYRLPKNEYGDEFYQAINPSGSCGRFDFCYTITNNTSQ